MRPTEAELDLAFRTLIKGVRQVDHISIPDFAYRLHNKAKSNNVMAALFRFIDFAPDFNPLNEKDSFSQDIGCRNASFELAHLAIACSGPSAVNVPDEVFAKDLRRYIWEEHGKDRYKEIIPILTSRCLEEHIDAKLISLGQTRLFELHQMIGFKDYAIRIIKSDRFLRQEIAEDLWNGHHLFSLYILFIADFLQDPWSTIPTYSQIQGRESYQVLKTWSYTLWDNQAKNSAEYTDTMVKFLGSIASITYAPKSISPLGRPTPAFDVMNSFYTSIIDTVEQGAYREQLQSSLDRLEHQKDVINEWKSYCENMESFFTLNLQPKWQHALNIASIDNQQQVWDWLRTAYEREPLLYSNEQHIKVIIQNPNWGRAATLACPLAQGTSILLPNGETRLVENLNTLSMKGHGVQVDELISGVECLARTARVVLIGFNGEAPFATPGQVFYTSTGLRAVDAKTARSMNPLQRIGRLLVGHVIYRRIEQGYESVEITSIQQTEPSEQNVYGVFLGNDQQLFHANGYLISQSPCTSPLQLAAELVRQLPKGDRLLALSNFQELSKMFRTYDKGTLEARLDLELEHHYRQDQEQLASLSLGTAVLTSDFGTNEGLNKSITKENKDEIHLDLIEREFNVTTDNFSCIHSNYQLPSIAVIDGRIIVDDEVQLAYASDPSERTFKWTRYLANQQVFEHGMIQIDNYGSSGNGVISLTADFDPKQIPVDDIYTFRLDAKSYSQTSPTFIEINRYKLTVDRDIWQPDTDKSQIGSPVSFNELSYGIYQDSDGVQVPTIQLHVLDQLRDSINTKLERNIDELYRFERQTIKKKGFRGTMIFHRASIVPFISDSGEDVNTFGVNFPQIGLDFDLPVLFQEFYLDFDFWAENMYGALFEFNPHMRGMMGDRHLVRADPINLDKSQVRSKVSRAFAVQSNPSRWTADSTSQPASITNKLSVYKALEVRDLITFTGYDEDMVHTTTQTFIQQMMYYHMDQRHREQFTTQTRPELPSELADSLPSKLKSFFKDKYAPAFLCRSIESFPKYATKFTKKERAKLWYWWEGNGKKCLSRSQEYNDLNAIASTQAMKYHYAKILDPFFNSADGPDVWAEKLRQKLGEKPIMRNLLSETAYNGSSPINKQCMVMNTLAPEKNFANEWFEQVVAFAGEIGLDYPFIDTDSELARQWLHDSMHDLVLKVLLGDPSITGEVREQLLKNISKFEEENNLDQKETALKRTAAIITKAAIFLAEAPIWFTAIGKGLSKALQGTRVYQWIDVAFDKVAQKVSARLPGTQKLKGLTSICMVGFYIVQIASSIMGAIQNWGILGDAQRATIILETLKIAVAGAGHSIEAFKKFSERSTTSGLEHFDMEYLNQGTSRALGEGIPGIKRASEEINGTGGFHDSVAHHVGGDGKTATKPSRQKKWNEKIGDPVGDIPPGSSNAAKQFSLSESLLGGLNIVLGIGVAAAMTFTLVREWDSLTDTGKIIDTLSIVIEVLSVLVSIVEFGAGTGVWVLSSTMSVALPIIGAVLAIVGLVLTVITFFVQTQKSDPPTEPIDEHIKTISRPLIASFDEAPVPQLTYSISHSEVTAGTLATIRINARNDTKKDVTLTNTRITVLTGDDDVCLFSASDNIALVSDMDPGRENENHTYVTPHGVVDANLPKPSKIGTTSIYYQMDLRIAGPKEKSGENALQKLVLKPSEVIQSIWTARINRRRDDSTSHIDIVELANNDKSYCQFTLKRI